MMRNRFDQQLEEMNTDLVRMGALCEGAIAGAVRALSTGDLALAQRVRDNGPEIDQMERDIEQRCMRLLLHQQPVAKDLRQISAALKMITDMERIGDQAEDIAEIVEFLNGKTSHRVEIIDNMAREAVCMVTDSVDAFVRKDVEAARAVIVHDNVVDEAFVQIKGRIIDLISQNQSAGEYALDLLMIAKYLERIADHATNLAEWVIFAVTGQRETNKEHMDRRMHRES